MHHTLSKGRARALRWLLATLLLLCAWGLRLCCLQSAPPGWRDDDVINMHALAGSVQAGSLPLYFTGASGHEPLFHYIQAGTQAVIGINTLSSHLPSAALGLLSVALTYAVAKRLFGSAVAAIASPAMTTSFWSLMYSRFALRHVSLVPFVLLCIYLLWRGHEERGRHKGTYVVLGLIAGLAMYTYFASRLIPFILAGYLVYLFAFHRGEFARQWRGIILAILLALIVVAPMAVTIVRGVGVDPRIVELDVPLEALVAGDPRLVFETTVETLGMFTTTGDPEWLYNIAGRPVFNALGGSLLWAGVVICLVRWRRPVYFLLVSWFAAGLTPAFVSIPPASLGHTIVAQPAAYMLVALALVTAGKLTTRLASSTGREERRARRLGLGVSSVLAAVFLVASSYRDLRDYFVDWPRDSLVRFLYRADYRDVANYLNDDRTGAGVAVGSTLAGPWDRLALEADRRSDDAHVRYFNPERALVWVAGQPPSSVFITDHPRPGPLFDAVLAAQGEPSELIGPTAALYELPDTSDLLALFCGPSGGQLQIEAHFANELVLEGLCWTSGETGDPSGGAWLITAWRVAGAFDAPPVPVIAYPPPPGVYVGPRLAVFAHLVSDGSLPPALDDGLWVDPSSLEPGDRFVQIHRFGVDPGGSASYSALEIGLYDPLTGERVPVLGSLGGSEADRIVVHVSEPMS
jgi:hypothetical protein